MIYILYGTIEYLIKKEITKIINDNQMNELDISKYNLNENAVNEIINDASSISLFDDKKIIIVHNATIFTGATNKKISEQDTILLTDYFNHINEQTILIFVVNHEKLDERKKIVKLAKKNGIVKEYNHTDTFKMVTDFFEGYHIANDTIKYLIDRVGDNIALLSNEIEKIKLYKYPDINITKEDIENTTIKAFEENNFKLIDAIITKNKSLAITLYEERLKLNEEPIAIIVTLANQIRIMYQTKGLYALGHSEYDIASILSIHPYRVKLGIQNGRKYDKEQLLKYLYHLAELDYKIKTGNIDKQMALEMFILNI